MHIPGFRKHGADLDISENYHLLCCFQCLVCFAVHSDYFLIKTCRSVCGETTKYSTAMGDVILERVFKYLLYCMVYYMYLKPEDYCYKYKVNASFVIDVMANLRKVSVTGLQLPRSCLSFNFPLFSRPVPSIRQM